MSLTTGKGKELREFADQSLSWMPIRLSPLKNERHYRAMSNLMNKLIDEIGDCESHPLMGLLDVVTYFVCNYEEHNIEIPKAEPAAVLWFLMMQSDLLPSDLSKFFGSQANAFEILRGTKKINARQACDLSDKFGVSQEVFV
jgi:HTH-type transcriptional regulator / antitoxin HigA